MPVQPEPETDVETYPMRVVARMTGLSPERLRAWESRHRAVVPTRTEGGSRRYSDADVERLRLLRQAVEAGHRIGHLVEMDLETLRTHAKMQSGSAPGRFDEMLAAVDALDATGLRRMLEERVAALGPTAFAIEEALPLAHEIGQRWVSGLTSIAAEHRATNVLRSILVEAVETGPVDRLAPRIVFASPGGERHDLGILAAAIAARGWGAQPIFVGADVPLPDLVEAAAAASADVLALGFVMSPPEVVEATLRSLRRALPEKVALWIGGRGINGCPPIRGVDRIDQMARLEAFVLEARESEDREGAR